MENDKSLENSGNFAISTLPLMTRERFAELIGLPASVLIAQTEKGYWPTCKIGKRVFVNVALVHQQCLERAFK